MRKATLRITLPEGIWVSDVSRGNPEATFRVFSAVPHDDGTGSALLRISGPDLPSVLTDVDDHSGVESLSLVQLHEGCAAVQLVTTAPLVILSKARSERPLDISVVVSDGTATVDVTGPNSSLSAFGEQLSNFGLEFEVENVHQLTHESDLLSERQREAVVTAIEHGYYDTPRRCTLTELADELGIAKSTCSETLHRAEERVMKRFVVALPDAAVDPQLPPSAPRTRSNER